VPFVSAAGVLALLDACLEVTGSMKGSVSKQTSEMCSIDIGCSLQVVAQQQHLKVQLWL
jgi:hypothetical protein